MKPAYKRPALVVAVLVLIVAPAIIEPSEYGTQAIVGLLFLIYTHIALDT